MTYPTPSLTPWPARLRRLSSIAYWVTGVAVGAACATRVGLLPDGWGVPFWKTSGVAFLVWAVGAIGDAAARASFWRRGAATPHATAPTTSPVVAHTTAGATPLTRHSVPAAPVPGPATRPAAAPPQASTVRSTGPMVVDRMARIAQTPPPTAGPAADGGFATVMFRSQPPSPERRSATRETSAVRSADPVSTTASAGATTGGAITIRFEDLARMSTLLKNEVRRHAMAAPPRALAPFSDRPVPGEYHLRIDGPRFDVRLLAAAG